MIAEDSHVPLTQAVHAEDTLSACDPEQSLEISRMSILARSSSSNREKAAHKDKPRFAEFTIPQFQVIRFAKACLDQLLPAELLGSIANAKHLHSCASMRIFFRCRAEPKPQGSTRSLPLGASKLLRYTRYYKALHRKTVLGLIQAKQPSLDHLQATINESRAYWPRC